MRRSALRRSGLALAMAALALACSSKSNGGKISGYTYCSHDVDCPSGQVCDQDDPNDSYCTPGCMEDADCPTQVNCPTLTPVAKRCEFSTQSETKERGVCDQFQGAVGPNSCRSTSSGGSGGGGSTKECTSDGQCSSKCSSGCYECSSNSCSCGYQGHDGCVF